MKDAVDEEYKGAAHGLQVPGTAIHDQAAPHRCPPVLDLRWFEGSGHRHGLEVSHLLNEHCGMTADGYQVRGGNRLRFEQFLIGTEAASRIARAEQVAVDG